MKKILLKEQMTLENIQRKALSEDMNPSNTKVVFEQVKVWELDVRNFNGRIYPTALAQRIVEEAKVTLSLDNHPHNELDIGFKDVRAITKNPQIQDGFLVVDVHFVDELYANRLEAILELGGKIGVSSFGYGTLDSDNVVEVETYELVRYLDFVINPSNQIYIKNKLEVEQPEPDEDGEIEEPDMATANIGEATATLLSFISIEELEALRKKFEGMKNGKNK